MFAAAAGPGAISRALTCVPRSVSSLAGTRYTGLTRGEPGLDCHSIVTQSFASSYCTVCTDLHFVANHSRLVTKVDLAPPGREALSAGLCIHCIWPRAQKMDKMRIQCEANAHECDKDAQKMASQKRYQFVAKFVPVLGFLHVAPAAAGGLPATSACVTCSPGCRPPRLPSRLATPSSTVATCAQRPPPRGTA